MAKIKEGDVAKRDENIVKLKSNIDDCKLAISELRINGLCLRCSGVAPFYFDEVEKVYNVRHSSCSTVVEKCAMTFSVVSEINSLYSILARIKASLGGTMLAGYEYIIATDEEATQWEDCARDVSICLGDPEQMSQLCSQITLSSDNQAIEGNIDTFAEGQAVSESIMASTDPAISVADSQLFNETITFDNRLLSSSHRNLLSTNDGQLPTDKDDSFGKISSEDSETNADLLEYFGYEKVKVIESGVLIGKILFLVSSIILFL